jgi:hypothetical protein
LFGSVFVLKRANKMGEGKQMLSNKAKKKERKNIPSRLN